MIQFRRTLEIPLHPFLYSLYPSILLCAQNPTLLHDIDTGLIALACLLIAGAIFILLRVQGFTKHQSGSMTTLSLVLFFSYGHIYSAFEGWRLLGLELGRHRVLLPISLAIIAIGYVSIKRHGRGRPGSTTLLNCIVVGLLSLPLSTLAGQYYRASRLTTEPVPTSSALPAPTPNAPAAGDYPDLYYIILDGYASARTLKDVYGFENTPFLASLRRYGFYVALASHANYGATFLSIASSMNMRYLDDVESRVDRNSRDETKVYPLIATNSVSQVFKGHGYDCFYIESGWAVTSDSGSADYFIRCKGLREVSRVFLRSTILAPLMGSVDVDQLRARILCAFDKIGELSKSNRHTRRPRFVFAHIVAPHPPFIFRADGGRPSALPQKTYATGLWKDKEAYLQQLLFINGKVSQLLEVLLTPKDLQPIVVIQADHGPSASGSRFVDEPPEILIRERMGILTAIRVPVQCRASLYETITPVNVFRVIFSSCYGANYMRLPDKSFYSPFDRPYELSDVTSVLSIPGEDGAEQFGPVDKQ